MGMKVVERLQEDERFISTLFNTIDAVVLVLDLEGKIIGCNDACKRMTGYDFNEIADRPCWDYLVLPEEMDKVKRVFQRLLQGEQQVKSDNYWVTKSGERRYIRWSSSAICDDQGQVEYIVTCGIDITEQYRMIEELRESEEKYRTLFESIPQGVLYLDEQGKILSYNPAAERMLDLSPEKIEKHCFDTPIYRLMREDGLEYLPNEHPAFQAFVTGQEVHNAIIGLYNPRREERRWINVHAVPLFRPGEKKPYQVYTTLEDITEQKIAHEEIARLDRLNLIGQMGAGIGHEVRNPMTTVKGFLQFLSEKKEYAKDKEYFDLMISEIDRANEIIAEFLSIAGTKSSSMVMANLNDIIRRNYPLIEANAFNMNKYIILELQPIPDLLLNQNEIQQMLLNLVRNGLEAVPEKGEVRIRTYVRSKEVVLEIRDNGEGIDPSLLDRLGTPFLSTKPQGTGLGLAICYGIAARHSAKIDVRTGPEGTSFFIKFPKPRKKG